MKFEYDTNVTSNADGKYNFNNFQYGVLKLQIKCVPVWERGYIQ